jgi:hypothetical protein
MCGRGLMFIIYCVAGLAVGGAAALAAPTTAAPDRLPAARAVEGSASIRWEGSLAGARAKARRTGKPLLVLHMFGKLTDPFC